MIIDIHTHAVPPVRAPSAAEKAAGRPYTEDTATGDTGAGDTGADNTGADNTGADNTGGKRRVLARGEVLRVLTPDAWDPSARLERMDAQGVRAQAVLPAPFNFLYGAEPALAADFAAEQNEAMASFCSASPERLTGFASVPLQDPDRAVAELKRAITDLGLGGVEIGTNAVGLQLHDTELDPFWAAAEDLDVPVFIHPGPLEKIGGSPEKAGRTTHSGLAFALARPVETELATGSLVFGGVLERHPRLRICLAHGGGGVPATAGRWEHGWARRTAGVRDGSVSPRVLLRRLWADTLTYDPEVLPLTERVFGSGHLVVGTDAPFAAQEDPPGAAAAEAARRGLFADPSPDLAANARAFLFDRREHAA